MINQFVEFVRDLYETQLDIPLHAPVFSDSEKAKVNQVIESSFVSTTGKTADLFAEQLTLFTGVKNVIPLNSGTSALHVGLLSAGVEQGDLVITQSLSFVATCNAIRYVGADPIFVDISRESLGLCAISLADFMKEHTFLNEGGECIHRASKRRIKAVLPAHTLGHPVDIDLILSTCKEYNLCLVEDAAAALGSYYKGTHVGAFGVCGAISFNGNKIITTGAGGAVLSQSDEFICKVKHLSDVAKVTDDIDIYHDEVGFNYKMPSINAALGIAQIEKLQSYIKIKRDIADQYLALFEQSEFHVLKEPSYAKSNYWLNCIICETVDSAEKFVRSSFKNKIFVRKAWQLIHTFPMYKNSIFAELPVSESLADRVVCLPSSVPAARLSS